MRSAALLTAAIALAPMCGFEHASAQAGDPQSIDSATRLPSEAPWNDGSMQQAVAKPLPELAPAEIEALSRHRVMSAGSAGSMPSSHIDSDAMARTGNVNLVPLKWAGRLFYTEPAGNMICSAQFISERVILTAAHCVRDYLTGKFFTNFLFALQYHNGAYSRRYSYQCVATKSGWVKPTYDRYLYDYAMLLTDSTSATGSFGVHWNWAGAYSSLVKIGYPRGVAGGQMMQVDAGYVAVKNGLVEMRHGLPFDQHGSSGGAWVGNYGPTAASNQNFVASIQSHSPLNIKGISYGPYFTQTHRDLLVYVSRGCK